MRKLLYLAILAALFFAPLEQVNLADLAPVEVLAVYREGDRVVLKTDTGARGEGSDAPAALEAMQKSTPAVIYLDTARWLLVAPGSEDAAESLGPLLRRNVQIAPYRGGDLQAEAAAARLGLRP